MIALADSQIHDARKPVTIIIRFSVKEPTIRKRRAVRVCSNITWFL
jgi:hypothetical protein